MTTYTVTFHPKKCTGAFLCTSIAPAFFKHAGKIATLMDGAGHDVLTRTVTCSGEDAALLREAAEKCPSNVIGIAEHGKIIVGTNVKVISSIREFTAVYDDAKEFVLDPKGYFLIRIIPEKQLIEIGFCGSRNTVEVKVTGAKPIDIYQTVLREHIIDRPDHAAYLGRELQKAYDALQLGIPYVQDDELDFSKYKK
ncbi:ferredoxin [Candidatus Woesearchaeota archaeon]|nr:ferredoxin [Candidatus Woesearchaeota archaeon]